MAVAMTWPLIVVLWFGLGFALGIVASIIKGSDSAA